MRLAHLRPSLAPDGLVGPVLVLVPVVLTLVLAGCADASTLGAPTARSPESQGDTLSPTPQTRRIATAEGPFELTGDPARIVLSQEADLAAVLESLQPDQRVVLQVRDLRADGTPGVLYHLYLGLAPGEIPAEDDSRHVGTVNFFDASPAKQGFYSFEVTEALRTLASGPGLADGPVVTVMPTRAPEPDARPSLGGIDLALEERSP